MTHKALIDRITQRNVESIALMEASDLNHRGLGEHCADWLAGFVGSWMFLILQSVLLVVWMVINVLIRQNQWDPYPFILLNLVLSFQSAFATPVILMSANRQARLNERRNQLDLQINLLAEQENTKQLRLLRLLCEKAGISMKGATEQALEQSTNPDVIVEQIVKTVEQSSPS